MKPAFRIILALSSCLAACGHSKPELFLDQTTTALECSSPNAVDCPHRAGADAGSPPPELDECHGNDDCEYAEVCERRHGVSLCQPADGRHGAGDAGTEDCDDRSDGDEDEGDRHHGEDRPDGGSAGCAPTSPTDDHPEGNNDRCEDDRRRDDDRSGSNSGPH